MKIDQVTLQNFRSFGPDPVVLRLDDRTALIGGNGTGKTNALVALVRMFSATPQERTLDASDVHVPQGKRLDELGEVTVAIEVRITLPEITKDPKSVAAVFNQMVVTAPKADPFCRMRLKGKWSGGAADSGEMDASLYWISTSDPTPKPERSMRSRRPAV